MLTCGGIHPGRVEPASPIELTTPRTMVLYSSQETFMESFLPRAWPKARGEGTWGEGPSSAHFWDVWQHDLTSGAFSTWVVRLYM